MGSVLLPCEERLWPVRSRDTRSMSHALLISVLLCSIKWSAPRPEIVICLGCGPRLAFQRDDRSRWPFGNLKRDCDAAWSTRSSRTKLPGNRASYSRYSLQPLCPCLSSRYVRASARLRREFETNAHLQPCCVSLPAWHRPEHRVRSYDATLGAMNDLTSTIRPPAPEPSQTPVQALPSRCDRILCSSAATTTVAS